MHELSIVMSILGIAREEASRLSAERVNEIEVEVGALSGADPESLEFVFSSACQDPMFSGCVLKLKRIKPKARCNACNLEFSPETLYDACPSCKSWGCTLLAGNELNVKTILIE